MAETYTIGVSGFAAAATKTAVSIVANASLRAKLIKIILGQTSAPASTDASSEWQLRRITSDGAGTATSATPAQADPLGPAATITGRINYTVEPTYATGFLLPIAINQRATFSYSVVTEGEKYMTDLTTSHGLGLQCISAPASSTWD